MNEIYESVSIKELYTLEETIAAELFDGATYPWEVLPKIKDFIITLGKTLPSDKYDEIKENDFNLSVSTYVEAEDTREVIDITKLNAEIEEIVVREQVLRDEIKKIIAEIEG